MFWSLLVYQHLLSVVQAEHIRKQRRTSRQRQTHKTKATDKEDSQDVLTNKEYRANKETLAAANIGLYLDQDNNLVGTLTFVEGEGKTVVEVQEYSQRTGAIYYKDKRWSC